MIPATTQLPLGARRRTKSTIVTLKISDGDLRRLLNYFSGAPYPYDALK